jgi:hypothetical protein
MSAFPEDFQRTPERCTVKLGAFPAADSPHYFGHMLYLPRLNLKGKFRGPGAGTARIPKNMEIGHRETGQKTPGVFKRLLIFSRKAAHNIGSYTDFKACFLDFPDQQGEIACRVATVHGGKD